MGSTQLQEEAPLATKPCARLAGLLFVGWLAAYASLATRHFGGDGLRWLAQVHQPRPAPGGVSHALFSVLCWSWVRIGQVLGVLPLLRTLGSEFPDVIWLQWMNAIAGAAGVSLFFYFLLQLRFDRGLAFLLACCVAASNGYLQCATDMLEPMPSVAVALFALCIVRRFESNWWAPPLAGGLLGLSGAIYQLGLSGGLLLAGVLFGAAVPLRRRFCRAAIAAVSASLVFGFTVWLTLSVLTEEGSARLVETAAGLFGHIEPRRLGGAAFGLANAVAPLSNWRGASHLLQGSVLWASYNIVNTCIVFVLCAVALVVCLRKLSRMNKARTSLAIAAGISLLVLWLFAAFWSAVYIKIWVFALPPFWLLIGEAYMLERSLRRPSFFLFGVLISASIASAIVNSGFESEDMNAARELANQIDESDLLVAPGWDNASVYLRTLLRPRQRVISMTDRAVGCKRNSACVMIQLAEAIDAAMAGGRRVFFYDLLQLSRADWNLWYGSALQIHYEDMEMYRVPALSRRPAEQTIGGLVQLPRLP